MNIALHGMEQAVIEFMKSIKLKGLDGTYIIKRRRSSSINIIRYADDFVILHENELVIKSCKEFIQNFLLNLGLKLNNTKTRICHTLYDFEDRPAGFDFLGFNFKYYKTHTTQRGYTLFIKPSNKSMKNIKAKVKAVVKDAGNNTPEKLIRE